MEWLFSHLSSSCFQPSVWASKCPTERKSQSSGSVCSRMLIICRLDSFHLAFSSVGSILVCLTLGTTIKVRLVILSLGLLSFRLRRSRSAADILPRCNCHLALFLESMFDYFTFFANKDHKIILLNIF